MDKYQHEDAALRDVALTSFKEAFVVKVLLGACLKYFDMSVKTKLTTFF